MTVLVMEKQRYVLVEPVKAPERPYFATLPLLGLPKISAPRECQLCDAHFRDRTNLVQHCQRQHGGFNEYRKRIFWEAERYHAQGLPGAQKRHMVANAATVYARPGSNEEFEGAER